MIAVIDYGMGNLRSVAKGLERVGLEVKVTSARADVADARGVVLPGVGAFKDCIQNLDRLGLIGPIKNAIAVGKPFLGICLGLQALFSESEEFGTSPGLGVLAGKVVRFPPDLADPDAPNGGALKVPHMGWNQVRVQRDTPFLQGVSPEAYVYFVHSYHVVPDDPTVVATTTDYGIEFVSSVARDNLFACQFHPEKSQGVGLRLLRNFGEVVDGG